MPKPITIKMSKAGRKRLQSLKKKGETFEQTIFSNRPLLTNMISKKNLKRLEKESFITRNAICQEICERLERQRRKK